jgi:hypothetical protein
LDWAKQFINIVKPKAVCEDTIDMLSDLLMLIRWKREGWDVHP